MRVMWVCDYVAVTLQEVAKRVADSREVELSLVSNTDLPGISVATLQCKSKVDLSARRRIREQLRRVRPDVVFAYTSRNLANTIAACRGSGTTPHLLGYRGTINRLHTLDPANWITFWHPRVDGIICVCEATQRALHESGVPRSRLRTIWEGCDATLLPVLDRQALTEFDIPADAFVVGTVANMRPVKGVDLLLQAAQQLNDRDIYWLLIGDVRDPRIHDLARSPELRERVRLPGPRSGGGAYTRLFDIYVAPSRMEGLSMGIMEAMAQAACPVVTNVGGSAELIRSEVDGIVVPPENVAELASAIRRLHDDRDLRQRLANSAQQRSATEFSIQSWTDRHLKLYREIMTSRLPKAA